MTDTSFSMGSTQQSLPARVHIAATELGQCDHIEQHACAMFDERVHVGNATSDRMRTADMGQATYAAPELNLLPSSRTAEKAT